MPQPKKGPRLGAGPSHQRQMLSNMAVSLFEHEKITTTETKAKSLRPFAERLITKAKRGGIHERRQVLSAMQSKGAVHKLFTEIAPRFASRPGGYTRVLKLGRRNGDGAPMAVIELVESGEVVRPAEDTSSESRRRFRRPGRRTSRGETTGEVAGGEPQPSGEPLESMEESSDDVDASREESSVEGPAAVEERNESNDPTTDGVDGDTNDG